MLQDYIPVLLLFVFATVFAAGMLVAARLLGQHGRSYPEKHRPFECGMVPYGEARLRFSVKFYVVAMLFLLFDIEVVFLYPWAVVARDLGGLGLATMTVFLVVLTLGWIYVLGKGALEWTR